MTTTRLTEIRADLEDGIDADDAVWLLSLAEQLQGQLDEARAENARPAAQERASGPETPQGHPSEGTGVPGPEKPLQTADGYTTAELISRTLVLPFGTRHNRGHIREIAAHIDNEIRPVHWREAAAFLRALGHDTAAEHKARRGGGPGSLTEAGAHVLNQINPNRKAANR